MATQTQRASAGAYPGRRRPLRAAAVVVAVGALLLAGCAGGGSSRTRGAAVVRVVTGLWPLEQAVSEIGQGNVSVVDVVPPGQDPLTYHLTASQASTVRHAGLVVQMGPTLQPGFAAAAAAASHVVTLADRLHPSDPYVWLDPYEMERVGPVIEAALVRLDPLAKATFANGLENFDAVLTSLDTDYQSTLGVCPGKVVVSVGDAFANLQTRYQVRVVPLDGDRLAPAVPSAADVAREVATVRRAGVHTVYSQPWFAAGGLIALQGETQVTVKQLDPLLGVPPGGWPRGTATYFGRMEANLEVLANALQCPNPDEQT